MNILKKAAAAVTAVALLAGMSVPAGAANNTMKLLTQEVDSYVRSPYGDGLYDVLNDDNSGIGKFLAIPQSSIKKWRSSGDLQITDVKIDGNINWNGLGVYVDVPQLYNRDSSGNISRRYAYTFDGKDTMKITETSTDWMFPARSGNIVYAPSCDDKGNLTFSARNSAGKTIKTKFKVGENPYDGSYWYNFFTLNDENYLGYVIYQTTDKPTVQSVGDEITFAIDMVDKNGKSKNVWKKKAYTFYWACTSGNNLVFFYSDHDYGYNVCMYDLKKGKLITYTGRDLMYDLLPFMKSDGTETSEPAYSEDLDAFESNYSNISIARYRLETDNSLAYCLVDLSSKDVKYLSSNYKEMYTTDGKMYLVKTYDDKWGYINAKGKFLGAFDDAGEFNGKYAPVIKNGKAYLIDRNLRCVSEKITADYVDTLDDGLYYVENGNKKYLMTYASGSSSSSGSTTSKPSTSGKNISTLEIDKLSSEIYEGEKIYPDPSIYDGDYLLEEKTDYTLTYKNNDRPGTGSVIIKGKGKYTGTKTLTFKITMKTPTLTAKKSGNSKAVLSWKKIAGASGYEIYYSTNNGSFKKLADVKGTTLSKTVTQLDFKKNSYKFRIRAYGKTSAGNTTRTSWSKTIRLG